MAAGTLSHSPIGSSTLIVVHRKAWPGISGVIIIHTASVLVFDWDMLWTNLDEILVFISHNSIHIYSQTRKWPGIGIRMGLVPGPNSKSSVAACWAEFPRTTPPP